MSYGVSIETILAAIRQNRRLIGFWQGKGMPAIAQSHSANVRDLQIMLLNTRFPNNTLPVMFGTDFTPVIKVSDDTVTDVISESDRNALADAIADETEFATGELVPSGV